MKKVQFSVPLEPIGAGRPRVTKRGTFTPKKTTNFEDQVRYYALQASKGMQLPKEANVNVYIYAYFRVPKSYTKERRARCLSGIERPAKKPDSDNIAKAVLDGLNPKMKLDKELHKKVEIVPGIYNDDKQAVGLFIVKHYDEKGHVDVIVEFLDFNGENNAKS